VAARGASDRARRRLERAGAVVWLLATEALGRVSIAALLGRLAAEGVNRVLVEGGGMVAGSFLRSRLVDRVHLFVTPMALGEGTGAFAGLGALPLERGERLRFEGFERVGRDLEIRLGRRA
jgi:diaminohydroxyphosphoribosylaminopyrimidine deaminase/5-amino-6-(5-phosphoribosylamino)uracil reductase